MSIDYDRFLDWAESRFGDVVVSGAEIKINSIFCEDTKHHLWCNPSGGKKAFEGGVYHCWKSDKKGSLIGLVMMVDGCSYSEAAEALGAPTGGGLDDLERRVNELFATGHQSATESIKSNAGIDLPTDCYAFDELPTSHRLRSQAEDYLKVRMIPTEGLFVCTSGRYRNRIIIPYRDKLGSIIYYNGRYVGDPGTNLRYMGPPKELGVGKGDVVFSRSWPSKGQKVYITEGEFDSISLDLCGFKSIALGGKGITDQQISYLEGLNPVLCLDADVAGGKALTQIASRLLKADFKGIRYVRPSSEYKDWNGLLVARGPNALKDYVNSQEKDYETIAGGDWEATSLNLKGMFGN